MSRMFPFITATWNPLGGECLHNCKYCWAKQLSKRYGHTKYQGPPKLYEKELSRVFQHQDFVFVCDMCDLFGAWVPKEMIQRVLDRMLTSQATFLLLTKNPVRYLEFDLPKNCVAGATIETDYPLTVSSAPTPMDRLAAMRQLKHRKMLSIEPIMIHSESFKYMVAGCGPEFIAIGYDNYKNNLEEPMLGHVEDLIELIESFGIKVYKKTMRESSSAQGCGELAVTGVTQPIRENGQLSSLTSYDKTVSNKLTEECNGEVKQ
jgi:hypothetical protein